MATIFGDADSPTVVITTDTSTPGTVIQGAQEFNFIAGDAQVAASCTVQAGSDTIVGWGGEDFLMGDIQAVVFASSLGGNDVLDAGGGNDILIGEASFAYQGNISGNDTLLAGDGNDILLGDASTITNGSTSNGDDQLEGGDGNDQIVGDSGQVIDSQSHGDDILVGGRGDDQLWGDAREIDGNSVVTGNDWFVFNFDTQTTTITIDTTQTETFAGWLTATSPSLSLSSLTQSQFSTQYTAWLHHLVSDYAIDGLGADVNGDGIISVGMQQNDPTGLPTIEGLTSAQVDAFFNDPESITVRTGAKPTQTQVRYYAGEFQVGTVQTSTVTTATSQDGHDTIYDFSRVDGNYDALRFEGLTFAQAHALITATETDANNDGVMDTVIHFTSETLSNLSWSVTLLSVVNFDFTTDVVYDDSIPVR